VLTLYLPILYDIKRSNNKRPIIFETKIERAVKKKQQKDKDKREAKRH